MGLKLFAIGFLILILLIPSFMIQNLIRERESRSQNVQYEITSKWGNSQNIAGPILTIPYKEYIRNEKGEIISSSKGEAHFLPENLTIEGHIEPDILYRSIYETVVYDATLAINGFFAFPDAQVFNKKDFELVWEEASISLGITDMKGINDFVQIVWDGTPFEFSPGVVNTNLFDNGVHVGVPINAGTLKQDQYVFDMELSIKGSEWLSFMPVGKVTKAHLSSAWTNPSFDGVFLPDEREVTEEGFSANWEILHFNRSYPQQWLDATYSLRSFPEGKGYEFYDPYMDMYSQGPQLSDDSSFGVNLLLPVDTYQKNMRAVKYAIMMLCLTFLSFFFIEVLNKKRIHPIQYLLVGFAIFIFYLLLLSISEYLKFSLAYIIATVAIVSLITAYCKAVFKNKHNTGLIALILLVLYGFFYSLLQLQDYALLMGSLGLFGILALVMYLSRHIDWYAWGSKE